MLSWLLLVSKEFCVCVMRFELLTSECALLLFSSLALGLEMVSASLKALENYFCVKFCEEVWGIYRLGESLW